MASYATAEGEPMEPVLRPIRVDMADTAERTVVNRGELVYTILVRQLGAGTATFEILINQDWIPVLEGDTIELGDCTPTRQGLRVRTSPALPGIFSTLIIGGTPDAIIRRP